MGFFKGFKESLMGSEVNRAEQLTAELMDLRRQLYALGVDEKHTAISHSQNAPQENWTREDTGRQKLVQNRIEEITAELKTLGVDPG